MQMEGRAKDSLPKDADVSGHSLRAGYVTIVEIQDLQPYQSREVTGHRSDAVLARYVRPVAKRQIPSSL